MRAFFLGSALLISSTISSVAMGQNTTTVVVSTPSHFKVGNKLYEGSLGGLRDYVDSLKRKDINLYSSLDSRLSELESKRNLGIGVIAAGGLVGLGIAFIPLLGSTSSDKPGETPSLTPLLVGLTVSTGSTLIGFALLPGRSDILKFVNEHNERNESSPIEYHLGFAPGPGGGRGYLSVTF